MFIRSLKQPLWKPADESGSGDDDDQNQDGDDNQSADNSDKSGKMISKEDIIGKKEESGDSDNADKSGQTKITERPDNIPEKFWNAEKGEPRTDSLLKAYGDLEKQVRGGKTKAPDDYVVNIDDALKSSVDAEKMKDDPMLGWFKGFAKENGLSQEQFDGALNGYMKQAAEELENGPQPPDPKVEREKLGKNADAIIENQAQFMKGLFDRGQIDEDGLQEMLIFTETAAGIKAFQALRDHYGDAQKIPMNIQPGGGAKTAAELQKMVSDSKYGEDPEYTRMVDAEYEKKYGDGNSGQSVASPL